MTNGTRPWRAAALLLALAACAAPGAEAPSAAAPPGADAQAWILQRLPTQAAGFQRGSTVPVSTPARGHEVHYATAGRAAAGFVQVSAGPATPGAVQSEFRRWTTEASRGAGPSRQLSVAGELREAGFTCSRLEGRYGRQPVESLVCVGAAQDQLLRVRVSMPRREPPVADARAFLREVSRATGVR